MKRAMTPKIIQKAFADCGLFPFNGALIKTRCNTHLGLVVDGPKDDIVTMAVKGALAVVNVSGRIVVAVGCVAIVVEVSAFVFLTLTCVLPPHFPSSALCPEQEAKEHVAKRKKNASAVTPVVSRRRSYTGEELIRLDDDQKAAAAAVKAERERKQKESAEAAAAKKLATAKSRADRIAARAKKAAAKAKVTAERTKRLAQEEADKKAKKRKAEADQEERSEERRVGKECRSRWSPYH